MLSKLGDVGKGVLPKWSENKTRHADLEIEKESEHDAAAPLLITPDESTVDTAGPSLGEYGTMAQSVESLRSVPETVVRKKDKGKKRVVDGYPRDGA